MRTTLTIDDDIVHKLKAIAARQQKSFKAVVNTALRKGLAPSQSKQTPGKIRLKTRKLQFRSGIDEMKLKAFLDDADVEDHTKS
ncbi:MAG: antitoxin [Verrucomicrobia bacterium]|nr:antitoxin [Verrucomicrobiota bacterium]